MSNTILLDKRPVGTPELSDFKFTTEEVPALQDGQFLLETKYVSVDPYLRGRMNDAKSYIPPFELHKPIVSGIIAEVLESKNDAFNKGNYVSGMLQWKKQQVSSGKGLMKVDPRMAPLSAYLGVLGLTGLTAYTGLMEIGKPVQGETLVVSGAAGAVGSIVGQIGKILGLRVVGIAGTDEKVNILKSEFGFDEGINYKTTKNMRAAIAAACPDGVDIYFDNVGGSISDAVLFSINRFARLIICGAISMYNDTSMPTGISVQPFLIRNSALMQGFIVSNYEDKFPEAIQKLSGWMKEGKLAYNETIVEGFENIPTAFLDLFSGKNKGKIVVKV
ncbi:NADP-dependent oxidoreductase [Fulvivirga sedimenti]|uniref:NADP-dependent oxidoreductase n=1 Tax=Fulvivirga sedimenti TaxID=2879465 RepID=A0A9X1KYX0_9BACT|nr:NADP-dependent oxidoreductase [Fulvivirga sedimenti]MCA6075267.1 NADP-dependent oxidoreductase [Fulvivirga sedimenti]MCA6076444.1 NADP-dependent oxidoreductase [Fulvivirga sedimenti]MCA6077572.1 NADP-dependent oxidoreductase [Fulvivirga sedimenti]